MVKFQSTFQQRNEKEYDKKQDSIGQCCNTTFNDIVSSFNEPVNVIVLPHIVILFIFIFNSSNNDIATKRNIYYV